MRQCWLMKNGKMKAIGIVNASPAEFAIHQRMGKIRHLGRGISFFKLPWIDRYTIIPSSTRTIQFKAAVDWLLKGPEYKLADGTLLVDKEGFVRTTVRAKWWIPIRPGMTHEEAAMLAGDIHGEARVPDGVSFPGYSADSPAVFFGHYWMAAEDARILWLRTSHVWTTAPAAAGHRSPIDSTASQS